MMDKAIFCISIDTELVWGRVHMSNIDSFVEKAQQERLIIKRILKLFKKYNIHATWAVVGHLFLSSCDQKHSEIIRPKYPWLQHDWFSHDPGTDVTTNPEWYGPDIVRAIQNEKNQEIGSHSFAHVLFNEKGMTKAAADSDLKQWTKVTKPFNLGKTTSFVYPQNKIEFTDLLKKYGFVAYRDKDIHWYEGLPKVMQTVCATIDLFMPTSAHNSTVKLKRDLVRIPSSFYFPSGRGIRKFIPSRVRANKAIRSIDNAINNSSIFHMWFHPTDLVDDQEKLFSDLECVLEYASKKRRDGKIQFMNMKEITQLYGN